MLFYAWIIFQSALIITGKVGIVNIYNFKRPRGPNEEYKNRRGKTGAVTLGLTNKTLISTFVEDNYDLTYPNP